MNKFKNINYQYYIIIRYYFLYKYIDISSNIKKVDHEVSSITETESSMDFKIGSSNQQTDDINGIENVCVYNNYLSSNLIL